MRIIRRESYACDFGTIVDYITLDNPAALDMWEEIERQVERLRDFPKAGRTGRMQDTRELIVTGTPYIVVYLVTDDVELIRVLHGAQKWPFKEHLPKLKNDNASTLTQKNANAS